MIIKYVMPTVLGGNQRVELDTQKFLKLVKAPGMPMSKILVTVEEMVAILKTIHTLNKEN